MLIILFGLPGTGKTYTGRILRKKFNFHFYDGDGSLPKEMKMAIENQQPVSEEMRDIFFTKLLEKIKELKAKYKNLAVAQTYIKDKYRKEVLDKFPDVHFILIDTENSLREKRLISQKTYPLTLKYIREMVKNFDKPEIIFSAILNNSEGEKKLEKKLELFFAKNQFQ